MDLTLNESITKSLDYSLVEAVGNVEELKSFLKFSEESLVFKMCYRARQPGSLLLGLDSFLINRTPHVSRVRSRSERFSTYSELSFSIGILFLMTPNSSSSFLVRYLKNLFYTLFSLLYTLLMAFAVG